MNSISIPVINTLNSTDAIAIREITFTLVNEIVKLNNRIDEMEQARKRASESSQRKKGSSNGV